MTFSGGVQVMLSVQANKWCPAGGRFYLLDVFVLKSSALFLIFSSAESLFQVNPGPDDVSR